MKNISGLRVPGTESYGYSDPEVRAAPSREFLREIAQLLETELEERSQAERNECTPALPWSYMPGESFPQGTVREYEDA